MAADLLAVAVSHLNLFTWLAEHPSTLGGICAHFGIHVRPADVLVTLCSAMGLLTEAGGVFHLGPRAREHFVDGSPWCLRPFYDTFKQRPQTQGFLQVLFTGRPVISEFHSAATTVGEMGPGDFAEKLTAAGDCLGRLLAPVLARKVDLSSHRCLLDVAGGSGIYACSLTMKYPQLRAVVYERPPLDVIARRFIAERACGERVSVLGGDILEGELPVGFDVILLCDVLHKGNDRTASDLISKAARALPPGGLVLIQDAFLDANKRGPLAVAQYSALLMYSSEGRCFSLGELRVWLDQNGLEWRGHHPTAVDRSLVIAEKMG